MKRNRLEKLCYIVETCVEGFFDKTKPEMYRISWYNHFSELLDKEIENDLKINVDELQITDFMKTLVKRHIEHGNFRKTYGYLMGWGRKGGRNNF
jgi:hypothetical protein